MLIFTLPTYHDKTGGSSGLVSLSGPVFASVEDGIRAELPKVLVPHWWLLDKDKKCRAAVEKFLAELRPQYFVSARCNPTRLGGETVWPIPGGRWVSAAHGHARYLGLDHAMLNRTENGVQWPY